LFSQSSCKNLAGRANFHCESARGDVNLLRDFRNQDVDILGGPGYDPQQTERSSSNDDGIEPEPSVSKKQVERLDGVYWSHGISITDTSLVYQRDFLGKESFRIIVRDRLVLFAERHEDIDVVGAEHA
jgi:hypothetical protein